MTQWDYIAVHVSPQRNLGAAMRQLGQEGWEFIGAVWEVSKGRDGRLETYRKLYFKRPIETDCYAQS